MVFKNALDFAGVKPKINIVDILKPADEVEPQQIVEGKNCSINTG